MRASNSLARLLLLCLSSYPHAGHGQEYYTRTAGLPTKKQNLPQVFENRGASSAVDIRIFQSSNDQSEPSIGINWCNPINLMIGANTVGDFGYGQGYFYSENSGFSWFGSETLPGTGYYTSDPSVAFDGYNIGNPNGYSSGYFNYLEFDGFSYTVKVAKTTDGGVTWFPGVQIPASGDPDKNHMAIDPTTGPFANHVYVGFTDFSFWPGSPVRISRSVDRGGSFSVPVNISGSQTSLFSQGVNVATGPNGNAYAVWAIYDDWNDLDPNIWDEEAIGFARSTNGGLSWFPATRILEIQGIRSRWTHKNSGGSATPIRVNGFPVLAVDRSGGPRNGHLYLTWANKGTGSDKADVLFSRSTNDGVTWSTPARVNNDITSNDQWFPWITVSPWGRITIVFYDSRVDLTPPVNQMTEAWIAESTDGGVTFTNQRVSDVSFMPTPVPGTATGYMGDYLAITSIGGSSYPCWPDTRTGAYQLFVDIHNSYAADLQNVATWNKSPAHFATAYGSSSKLVYAAGKWHRLVHMNEYLAYAYSSNDGATWTNHLLVNGSALGWLSNPSLFSHGGKLHAIFRTDGNDLCYLRGTTGGVWEPPRVLGTVQGTLRGIASAIDLNGIGHLAYSYTHSQTGNDVIAYSTFNSSDINPVLTGVVTLAASYGLIETPALGLDPQSNLPHVAWSAGGDVHYRYKTGTSWVATENVSTTSNPSHLPALSIVSGMVHLVWQEDLPANSEVFYRARSTGAAWGGVQNLSNTVTASLDPAITGLTDGLPLVVWADSLGGSLRIRFHRPVSGESGEFGGTTLQSRHPACGVRRITGGSRVVLLYTDGPSSLYNIGCGKRDFSIEIGGEAFTVTAADDGENEYGFLQNSPNPFNPTTTIRFSLKAAGRTELKLFDILGRELETILDEYRSAGSHDVFFDGSSLSSGIYLYRLQHHDGVRIGRMILAK